LLDWDKWTELSGISKRISDFLFSKILEASRPLAPQILSRLKAKPFEPGFGYEKELADTIHPHVIPSDEPGEQWVTLFLSGSRGMSHEQVRHRFCISQRSTRYVDENESPWIQHPVVTMYTQDTRNNPDGTSNEPYLDVCMDLSRRNCNNVYVETVEKVQKWLIKKGVDKTTARKQARGAARGWLGNALCTELLFSAPINMWAAMLRLRCNPAADAEIRVMYADVLRSLKQSQYASYFEKMSLARSPDGIGEVLVEN
jgi:hypothetical protein